MTDDMARRDVVNLTAPLPVRQDEALQLVLLSPKTGMEQAFDQWYLSHLSEIVRIPGVSSARRNKVLPVPALGITLPPSMAIYALEASTVDEIDAEVIRRMEDGRISRSDAVDYAGLVIIKAKPLGPGLFGRNTCTATDPQGRFTPPKEYQLIIFSDPATSAVEHEYNDWCDQQFIPELLRIPGFLLAQRFVVISALPNSDTARHFILFNLRSRDLEATNAELLRRIRSKGSIGTTAMDQYTVAFMEPVGPPVLASPSQTREWEGRNS
jgi:hypothetical protein